MNSIKKVKNIQILVVNNEKVGNEAAKIDFGQIKHFAIE